MGNTKEQDFFVFNAYIENKEILQVYCNQSSQIEETLKIQHEGEIYPCLECEYAEASESSLRISIEIKHKEARDPSFQCEFATTRAVNMKRLVKIKHAGSVRFPCSKCEYARRSEISFFSM